MPTRRGQVAGPVPACDSSTVDTLWAAEPVNWSDVAAVRLLGIALGTLLLLLAIRAMFGRGGR